VFEASRFLGHYERRRDARVVASIEPAKSGSGKARHKF
jgi:hypothetical protein